MTKVGGGEGVSYGESGGFGAVRAEGNGRGVKETVAAAELPADRLRHPSGKDADLSPEMSTATLRANGAQFPVARDNADRVATLRP
ncbi:MAG: hypothetical protein QOD99_2874 [Chthoniobacter sp.]|nr:hypothetical protein [Chthoniobacter sp.]